MVSFFACFSWLGVKPRPWYVWGECSKLSRLRRGAGAPASTSFVEKSRVRPVSIPLLCDVFMAAIIKACVGLYGGVSHLLERAKGAQM